MNWLEQGRNANKLRPPQFNELEGPPLLADVQGNADTYGAWRELPKLPVRPPLSLKRYPQLLFRHKIMRITTKNSELHGGSHHFHTGDFGDRGDERADGIFNETGM